MATTGTHRRALSPAQRARYALRQRLKNCAAQIERLVDQVETKHADPSGGYWAGWIPPPADNSDLRGSQYRPGLLDQWDRITHEARQGCAESAAFIERYGAMLRLALHLRQQRPPKRDPTYNPQAALSPQQLAWIAGREVGRLATVGAPYSATVDRTAGLQAIESASGQKLET